MHNKTREHVIKRFVRNEQSGFTLIELILVTVIIGILAGMVALNIGDTGHAARVRTVKGDISTLGTAIDMYALDHNGKLPATLDILATGDEKGRTYIKDLPRDPWKNPYMYEVKGTKYDLFSNGTGDARVDSKTEV